MKHSNALIALSTVHMLLTAQFLNELNVQCLRMVMEQKRLRSEAAKRRKQKIRIKFSTFVKSISSRHFRRMFRMPLECYHMLCKRIEDGIGEEKFLSEQYIMEKLQNRSSPHGRMYEANCKTTGGYISGEVKVAIAIRILAGASYLDVSQIFGVTYSTCYEILHHVTERWFCQDWVSAYSLEKNLTNPGELYKTCQTFAAKGRSRGVLGGIIGALDGWLVKIRSPSWRRDGVKNSGNYFSRKGFFALNVQVIVDREKRIIWRAINARGSEHDSSAFKDSGLYTKLERIALGEVEGVAMMYDGIHLYLIGDSAYALRPFLLCPYDKAQPGSAEDVFNFMLSSNRIFVECAFGEIDARFGIFCALYNSLFQNNVSSLMHV